MLLENIGTSVLVSKDQVICNAFLAKNIVEENVDLVRVGAMCSFSLTGSLCECIKCC